MIKFAYYFIYLTTRDFLFNFVCILIYFKNTTGQLCFSFNTQSATMATSGGNTNQQITGKYGIHSSYHMPFYI